MTNHDRDPSSENPPIHTRVLDAFHQFYLQLGVIEARSQRFAQALTHGIPASAVLSAAELECAWSILDARIHLVYLITNDEASRDFWTLPAMAHAVAQLRSLIRAGAEYLAQHGLEAALLMAPLRGLQARVEVQERLIVKAQQEFQALSKEVEDACAGIDDDQLPDPPIDEVICFEARRTCRAGQRMTPPPEVRRYSRRWLSKRPRRRAPS